MVCVFHENLWHKRRESGSEIPVFTWQLSLSCSRFKLKFAVKVKSKSKIHNQNLKSREYMTHKIMIFAGSQRMIPITQMLFAVSKTSAVENEKSSFLKFSSNFLELLHSKRVSWLSIMCSKSSFFKVFMSRLYCAVQTIEKLRFLQGFAFSHHIFPTKKKSQNVSSLTWNHRNTFFEEHAMNVCGHKTFW